MVYSIRINDVRRFDMFECRPVQSEDYPVISTFPRDEEELFYMFPKASYPLTPDQIETNSNNRLHPTVVVSDDNKVAGYANLYGQEDGDRCWLGNVIISPDFRGTSAAGTLIQHMVSFARDELKVKFLNLCCHNSNMRALFFYTRLGFKPYEIVKLEGRQGQAIAGVYMRMELSTNELA